MERNINVADYYNRFKAADNYKRVLFRDGYVLQGAELNEMQDMGVYRLRGIADALFKDGDIVKDAQIAVDPATGVLKAQAGQVYLDGEVRDIPAAAFTIPVSGSVSVGVRLVETVVSEQEDAGLYNPAAGSRGEGEAGAWRLKVSAVWGFDGDGKDGSFFPVHVVDDGIVRAKELPPNLGTYNQALAQYDRDSTKGGSYIVSGLTVRKMEDAGNAQVYTVAEGRARVAGCPVDLPTSRRLVYNAAPDLRLVDTEVHSAAGDPVQRVTVAHPPIYNITQLRATLEKTVSMVHGAFSGAADTLPDTSVVDILECKMGDTVYVKGTDYKKTGDAVDWSPAGNEPSPGSTYQVRYTYVAAVEPESPDLDGFSLSGVVGGSSIMVSYNQALPRVDCLCLTSEGVFSWVKGIAAEFNPRTPAIPSGALSLATIRQTWRPDREVKNDGPRVMSFEDFYALQNLVEFALEEIARQRLESDVATREAGATVGVFVDPLLNDEGRDQGIEQTAAVVDGELTLPIAVDASPVSSDVAGPAMPAFTPSIMLAQELRTGEMAVNPYMAFAPLPADVTLTPAVDRWTEVQSNWASPVTQVFNTTLDGYYHILRGSNATTTVQKLASTSAPLEYLRQIDVRFKLEGFGPGEELKKIVFDGVEVPALSL